MTEFSNEGRPGYWDAWHECYQNFVGDEACICTNCGAHSDLAVELIDGIPGLCSECWNEIEAELPSLVPIYPPSDTEVF